MKNLPFDYEYDYDDDALKACIYSHFEKIIIRGEEEKRRNEAGAGQPSQPLPAVASVPVQVIGQPGMMGG